MVPGAAHLNLQKMQWSKQGCMLIATDASENVNFEGFGSHVSMQHVG
jgi:hypothetical protein